MTACAVHRTPEPISGHPAALPLFPWDPLFSLYMMLFLLPLSPWDPLFSLHRQPPLLFLLLRLSPARLAFAHFMD